MHFITLLGYALIGLSLTMLEVQITSIWFWAIMAGLVEVDIAAYTQGKSVALKDISHG